jgi:hypothetical protein
VENNVVEVLVGAGVLVLTTILGMVWIARARAARRFYAAVDAYAEREIARERRWNGPRRMWSVSTPPHALAGGSTYWWRTDGEE